MPYRRSLNLEKRSTFEAIVEQLPGLLKVMFHQYLEWRNAPVGPVDYNLACMFRDRRERKPAGDKTETLLCESLKEAMEAHTVTGVFRSRFERAWKKRMLAHEIERGKERRAISVLSLKTRQTGGGTYIGHNSFELSQYGFVHRKSGHS